jgi:putative membrane protein
MIWLANAVVIVVVLVQIWALALEMYFWKKPMGLRTFGQSLEQAENSAVLASNQGLYNGLLAAFLLFGLFYPEPTAALHFKTFVLACIAVAGAYGGYTVGFRLFLFQGVPAIVAIVLLWIAGPA